MAWQSSKVEAILKGSVDFKQFNVLGFSTHKRPMQQLIFIGKGFHDCIDSVAIRIHFDIRVA